MPSNKERLYVALYPSGVVNNEERRYHWGFLSGPKIEGDGAVPGGRYHVKNSVLGWQYEENELGNVKTTVSLLARILIAKIEDKSRLLEIIRSQPVVQDDPTWRCRTCVAGVLKELMKDGRAVGTSELDWNKIEATARKYVAGKIAARRYQAGAKGLLEPKPTWDMLENKELVD